jgi:ABC-type glutathione transport system ATPase component
MTTKHATMTAASFATLETRPGTPVRSGAVEPRHGPAMVQEPAHRPVLRLADLRRTFRQGSREIPVLAGASATLWPGEAVALVGPSGAGK